MDARQRGGGDHVRDHVDGVVLDHADVGEARGVDAVQQRPHAGSVDFEPQEVELGMGRGDGRRRLAHAEADFQDDRRDATEYRGEVEGFRRISDAQPGQQRIERPLLRRGHSALPQDETAHGAALRVIANGSRGRHCGARAP
jgi:hypothetical protein